MKGYKSLKKDLEDGFIINFPRTFLEKKKERKENKYKSCTFGTNTRPPLEQIINMHLFSHYFS